MGLTLVTPPSEDAVSPYRIFEHLRLDAQPQDEAIFEDYLEVAIARLDGRNGLLGRCLITQVWKLTLPWFPPEIVVPLPPLQSVDQIVYIDDDGNEQTLDSSGYAVYGTDPATIKPAHGTSFPSTRLTHLEAVSITFTAGYGDSMADVPQPIRQAIAMDVGHLDQHRETVLVGQTVNEIPMGYMDLIAPYRQWSF